MGLKYSKDILHETKGVGSEHVGWIGCQHLIQRVYSIW